MNRVYYGKIGGGKTHCVIFQEIIPALRAGRTVYTNIDSLDIQGLRNYIGNDVNLFIRTSLKWWRQSLTCDVIDDGVDGKAVLNPALSEGALYVIDECQFVWDAREFKDTKSGFLHLLEYNRHFGIDIVFVTQNVKRCDVNIGRLANDSYQIKNLGFLHGLARNKYVVNRRQTPFDKDVISQYTQSYIPALFSLYKSGANAHTKKQKAAFSSYVILPFVLLIVISIVVLVKQGNPIAAVGKQFTEKQNKGVNKNANNLNSVSPSSSVAIYQNGVSTSFESHSATSSENSQPLNTLPVRYGPADLESRCFLVGYISGKIQGADVKKEYYDCPEASIIVSNGKRESVYRKLSSYVSESLKQQPAQSEAVKPLAASPALAEGGKGSGSSGDLVNNANKSNTITKK